MFIMCSKGSLGPSLQPVVDVQSIVDTRHRNLLVEIYNDHGDLQSVVKYDAVFDEEKKIKARKEAFKDKFGQWLTAEEVIKRWPDCQIDEIDEGSFSLDRADAYLKEVNNLDAAYNPVTDNCQEFVDELLCAATGFYGPVPTLGDQLISVAVRVIRSCLTVFNLVKHVIHRAAMISFIVIALFLPVVHYVLPPGDIWISDVLSVFYSVFQDVAMFIHLGLWFYFFPCVARYIWPVGCALSTVYAPVVLIAKFYSCDADVIEQWTGITGFEGCWIANSLLIFVLVLCIIIDGLCKRIIDWVPPEVSVLLINFIIEGGPFVTWMLPVVFDFDYIQLAQKFAAKLGGYMMR